MNNVSDYEKYRLYQEACRHLMDLDKRGNLDMAGLDELDFFEVSVWGLANALEGAYLLGLSCLKDEPVKKSSIVKTLEKFNFPMTAVEIANDLRNNVNMLSLYESLNELVARNRLETWVSDDGRILYQIKEG